MQVAAILSDLTSLRVCDPSAALALVSARPSPSTSNVSATEQSAREEDEDADADLKRAKDLVELHYAVKVRYRGEVGRELEEGRGMVRRVVGW